MSINPLTAAAAEDAAGLTPPPVPVPIVPAPVETGTAPAADSTVEGDEDLLDTDVPAVDEAKFAKKWEEYERLAYEIKKLEDKRDNLKSELLANLGNSAVTLPNGRVIGVSRSLVFDKSAFMAAFPPEKFAGYYALTPKSASELKKTLGEETYRKYSKLGSPSLPSVK